ncbi:MAG: hypothetical protein ABI451_11060, partial [Dokdonella sp.]
MALLLEQWSDGAWRVADRVNFTNTMTVDPPSQRFSGRVGFQIQGSQVRLIADRVDYSCAFGVIGQAKNLRMRLLAFNEPFTGIQPGWDLGQLTLGSISCNYYLPGINGPSNLGNAPSSAIYRTMFLEVQQSNGTWGYSDYVNFPSSTTAPPSYSLTLQRTGTGAGTITSNPSGINCGSTCQAGFAANTSVTLTAIASSGSQFAGWSGACSGASSTCSVTMSAAKSITATFNTSGGATPSALLRFDSPTGPTAKTIVQNSGTSVTFAWQTTALPAGTTCRIYLRPNNTYAALASPTGSGALTSTTINHWATGTYSFYMGCSNGTASSNLTLAIQPPLPAASLHFDSAAGPTSKTIARNSGTPVTFAWQNTALPAGTSCRIYLRPNNTYAALASPTAGGTLTNTTMNNWATGAYTFYLGCSNGTASSNVTLVIQQPTPAASLRFDSTTGPTSKTIARNSGTTVTFAWQTTALPAGTTCRIYLRPNNTYAALDSPTAGGTLTKTTMNNWATGTYTFYLGCSNGTASGNITLVIEQPVPSAALRFDSAAGPASKTVLRNSGTPVKFAWTTTSLPSGTTCRIYLRPNDGYAALASPTAGGTLTNTTMNNWATGTYLLYLGCSNGIASPNVTLVIQSTATVFPLTISKIGDGTGTVTSSPSGINCGSICSGNFAANSTVTLTAAADANSVFTGWSGECSGTGSTCTLSMSAAKTVTATFSYLGTGVTAIAAGGNHTCALTQGGAVKCWGRNADGQLGDGTATDRLTPVNVSGLDSGVQAITAGGSHTCALTHGGAVKCWGSNSNGQLGDGTATPVITFPVNVSGL